MFQSVLVANRGEIACRVTSTLRRLGIRSVAVHSWADADARHVGEADAAVRLRGPSGSPRAAYLDVDAVIGAAVAAGADAIHPGYGFLSESPALALACERAGITFVGPPPRAVELMADKLAAKRLVASHGVPVLPGTLDDAALGAGMPADLLGATAADVGYPLLVKPTAGGGGKGMVVVRSADDLIAALDSARRVAAASFGDDALLLERLVDRPRHIEVQVLADSHGSVVHLGERECTLQRRYQKVVEEAPSPALDDGTRARLGEAACAVARSVGYVGAGTVEFLVPADDPTSFWFIEMNTRLQVEHPVTELVTGLDLVELQLRVAAGEPLPFAQEDVQLSGHAVEARLYAESAARGFLPAAGTVLAYDDADAGAGPDAAPLRLDSGIAAGSQVTGDFDPMLAKVIAHGADRAEALDRLDGLLGSVVVLGVETNAGFLRELIADEDVRAGRLDTGLIDRLVARGGPAAEPDPAALVAAALLARKTPAASAGAFSASVSAPGPWSGGDGWRLNAPAAPRRVVLLDDAGAEHLVLVAGPAEDAVVTVDEQAPVTASLRPAGRPHAWRLTLDGVTRTVHAVRDGAGARAAGSVTWVAAAGRTSRLTALDRGEQAARRRALRVPDDGGPDGPASAEVRAAMPGTVISVPVEDGATVEGGATVVVVEAMKMEHALVAPRDGTVRLQVRPGDLVRLDQVVAVVDETPGPAEPAAPVPHSHIRGAS